MRAPYSWLIRLYPRRFRQQFETELLDVFDDARRNGSLSTARLLADTIVSVLRQWFDPATTEARSATGPLVQLDDYRMHRWAMVDGLLMSCGLLAYLTLLLNPAAQPTRIAVGAPDYPAPRLLTVARDTLSAEGPRTQVLVPPRPVTLADRLHDYTVSFFQIPLLMRLDENADRRLSLDEIEMAPQVLATFDANRDGQVTSFEIGISHAAIRILPITRALDADRDFAFSPAEISNAPGALRRLDLTRDGELGIIELMPEGDFQYRVATK